MDRTLPSKIMKIFTKFVLDFFNKSLYKKICIITNLDKIRDKKLILVVNVIKLALEMDRKVLSNILEHKKNRNNSGCTKYIPQRRQNLHNYKALEMDRTSPSNY